MTQLKLAFRNFRKYPVFSLINLSGLSIGIAASFILLVYSQRELNCDRHFRDADRIVRIGTDFFNMGGFAKSQSMLQPLLQADCPDVQSATAMDRAYKEVPVRTSIRDRAFTDIFPYYVDAAFFKVFSYSAVAGSIPENGLAPGQAILSATDARKFFGDEDPIGKTLLIGKANIPHTVVAVLKEGFEKSHLAPSLLLPLPPEKSAGNLTNWSSEDVYTYVKLKPQGSQAGLQWWLDRLLQKVVYPASGASTAFAQWREGDMAVKFILQPLTGIYFHSDLKYELSPGGNLTQVNLLSMISIFLILLAIINYTNLVTARASIRSREIGVKKAFGASRKELIIQLLMESLVFSLLAMLLACGLIQVILFIYQSITGAPLTGPMPLLKSHYAWLLLFSAAVGIVAGVYPAFYLTSFTPRLYGRLAAFGKLTGYGKQTGYSRQTGPMTATGNPRATGHPGAKAGPGFRSGLVLLQFTIAATLLFVSFVIYGQLQFMKARDKGFRAEGVVVIENADALQGRAAAFQHLVEQQSQVVSTSFCKRTPGDSSIWMYSYRTPDMKKVVNIQTFPADDQYITTLGMRLSYGRNFNKDLSTDTNSLILNESAVAALGLFNPIGATINGSEKVIGVVKDFNYASLREKAGPAILRFSPQGDCLLIRIRGGQSAAFLDILARIGKQFLPDQLLAINFLDDNFAKLAAKERLLGNAITFFTVLAILLAILGLIGLTLFTIERRRKEIGIRKVLGAGAGDILGLVSRDFIRLAAIASLIALPAGWWLVHRWLENFAYRTPVSIRPFFMTESVIIVIAFSVISLLSLRVAMAEPVKNLRNE